jgi:hypothetical protein
LLLRVALNAHTLQQARPLLLCYYSTTMHIQFLPHMKTTLAVHFSSASGVSGFVTPHFM